MSGYKKDQLWRTMKYPNYCGQAEGVPNPNIPDSGLFLYGYTATKNPTRLPGGHADFFLQKTPRSSWPRGFIIFNCVIVPFMVAVDPIPITLYTDISPSSALFSVISLFGEDSKELLFIKSSSLRGFPFLSKLIGEYKSINSTCVVYKLCVFNVSKYGSNEILL